MSLTSRTTNPLHFEDLEPRRFEDLTRQLIYDFRNWNALEATGRQGADDGFDVRGWEIVRSEPRLEPLDEETADDLADAHGEDRIWLVQCKREKTIGPKKLVQYLEDISAEEIENLHGLLLVASCDFSKKSRDDFRSWCIEKGIREFYVWGRGELEDLLFLPKNDHLLFAYFGISLQIRQRSNRTRIRSILSVKRQLAKHVANVNSFAHQDVLIRDPDAVEYPYAKKISEFNRLPKWKVYQCVGHYSEGLSFVARSFFAYYDSQTTKWDAEESFNLHWKKNSLWIPQEKDDREWEIRNWLQSTPNELQGFYEIIGLVPYEEIIAVDELGDEYTDFPHIYVRFDEKCGPFYGGQHRHILTYQPTRDFFDVDDSKRISHFPEQYPPVNRDSDDHPLA